MNDHKWIYMPNGSLQLVRKPDGTENFGEYVLLEKAEDQEEKLKRITDAIKALMKQAEESIKAMGHHEYVKGSGDIVIKEDPDRPEDRFTVGIKYTVRDLEFKETETDE